MALSIDLLFSDLPLGIQFDHREPLHLEAERLPFRRIEAILKQEVKLFCEGSRTRK